jgi:hypothetical protein
MLYDHPHADVVAGSSAARRMLTVCTVVPGAGVYRSVFSDSSLECPAPLGSIDR